MRVRHAQFGVGNVIAVEEHTDDFKVTVRFNTVGVKKLLAKIREARTWHYTPCARVVALASGTPASRRSSARPGATGTT